MFNIHVERVISKNINTVFDVLSDVGRYSKFRGVRMAKILEPGNTEPFGLGALRYVDTGPVQFNERITQFERPNRLDYKIERARPLPFRHELGSITLTEVAGGTKVVWVSKGRVNIPLLGRLFFDKKVERQGNQAFGSLLKQLAQLEDV